MGRKRKKLTDAEADLVIKDMDDSRKNEKIVSNKEVRHLDQMLKKIKLHSAQKKMIKAYKENEILFVFGPAGTAKTFTSCYCALDTLINDEDGDRIILIKPTVEASKSLGALPGDEKEKTDPYMQSYYDNFGKILGATKLNTMLLKNNTIKVENLQYMRGRTFDDSIILLDEAQNCSYKEIMLAITRLGKNSKMIIFGDVSQYDIREKDQALRKFFDLFKDIKGIGLFEFQSKDIVRAGILIKITEVYEQWRKDNKLD